MTFEALEAAAVRQRQLHENHPQEYRYVLLIGIRNRAALIERFFSLGEIAAGEGCEHVLPEGKARQEWIATAIKDLAQDIVDGAQWLNSNDEPEPQTTEKTAHQKAGVR